MKITSFFVTFRNPFSYNHQKPGATPKKLKIMKAKHKIKRQISTEYINLCLECEIPVKEALKYGYTLGNLKQQILLNNKSFSQSVNPNCE